MPAIAAWDGYLQTLGPGFADYQRRANPHAKVIVRVKALRSLPFFFPPARFLRTSIAPMLPRPQRLSLVAVPRSTRARPTRFEQDANAVQRGNFSADTGGSVDRKHAGCTVGAAFVGGQKSTGCIRIMGDRPPNPFAVKTVIRPPPQGDIQLFEQVLIGCHDTATRPTSALGPCPRAWSASRPVVAGSDG